MIRYIDTKGDIHEEKYDENTTNIDLSFRNITEILEMTGLTKLQSLCLNDNDIKNIKGLYGLTNLQELYLYNNCIKEIKEIKGLDGLTNLLKLNLTNNQIKEINGLDGLISLQKLHLDFNRIREIKGLSRLISLQTLLLEQNRIKEIKGLNGLTSLRRLYLSNNRIRKIKGLNRLTCLQELYLFVNRIREIKGLEGLISLQKLYLDCNRIKEIKGLGRLISLKKLDLSYNQITEIKGLDRLTDLQEIVLSGNQIINVPFTIMNLRHLTKLCVNCEINIVIQRLLNRNRIKDRKDKKTIYDDYQNVHDSTIVKSIKESIYNIISESKSISFENISKEIIDDNILTSQTKSQLIEYCQDKTVHSLLNVTFEEVLCSVWKVIIEHKESNEIKEILNVEMKDSLCKCFTGRLSRLVNCLNGFDERVQIKISDNEQILNVIIKIRNKYVDDISKQKKEVEKELTERGFNKDVINEYIVYLE